MPSSVITGVKEQVSPSNFLFKQVRYSLPRGITRKRCMSPCRTDHIFTIALYEQQVLPISDRLVLPLA